MLTSDHANALTAIALFAAFADDGQSDAERTKVRELMNSLGTPAAADTLRRVVFKETSLEAETAKLDSPQLRTLAWESAIDICESDGATSPTEQAFLAQLAQCLGRPADQARADIAQADALRSDPTRITPPLPAAALAAAAPDPKAQAVQADIQKYAILTAAIELLPQGMATMAIIPLQIKLVHGIGATYGYGLSSDSIKEFIATLGVGFTGQVVEQYARKFLGSIGGMILGGLGKTATNWATGPAMTFATTWAIGSVAAAYYKAGRTLSNTDLKALFGTQVDHAQKLFGQYESQIRQTAAPTNASSLLASLRK
jgi:uncharacterized protein (DUF697 family)/tellurite resistance protein